MKNLLEDVLKIGLAAGVIVLALPDLSFAEKLADSVQEVRNGMQIMPTVLSGVAYLAGGATMLHGAGLLKKHADQPQQTALAPGVTRMALGGAVAALPTLIGWAEDSLRSRGQNYGFDKLQDIS